MATGSQRRFYRTRDTAAGNQRVKWKQHPSCFLMLSHIYRKSKICYTGVNLKLSLMSQRYRRIMDWFIYIFCKYTSFKAITAIMSMYGAMDEKIYESSMKVSCFPPPPP